MNPMQPIAIGSALVPAILETKSSSSDQITRSGDSDPATVWREKIVELLF